MPDADHRELHDRWVNNRSEVYLFPDDEEEDIRLLAESQVLDFLLRPFYDTLDTYFTPRNGSLPKCLDLGCARGVWIAQMSKRHAHCRFTGVDLCPARPLEPTPSAEYFVTDFNLGLDRFHGQFDIVHARNICPGVQRLSSLVAEIGDVLKPRGCALFVEWDFVPYNANQAPYISTASNFLDTQKPIAFGCGLKPTERCPGIVHFLRNVVRASTSAGSNISAVNNLGAYAQRSGAFDQVMMQDVWIPVVGRPGAAFGKEREIAARIRPVFVAFINSCRPLLLSQGVISPSELSELEDCTRIEIMGCKYPIFIRFIVVSAVKNG